VEGSIRPRAQAKFTMFILPERNCSRLKIDGSLRYNRCIICVRFKRLICVLHIVIHRSILKKCLVERGATSAQTAPYPANQRFIKVPFDVRLSLHSDSKILRI